MLQAKQKELIEELELLILHYKQCSIRKSIEMRERTFYLIKKDTAITCLNIVKGYLDEK